MRKKPLKKINNHQVRNTTLTQRAKFLYVAYMTSIITGTNEKDIIRVLANFKQVKAILTPTEDIDIIILDILQDIATEQGITNLTDSELLTCLQPQNIKNDKGEITQGYFTIKQVQHLTQQIKKLHKKAL